MPEKKYFSKNYSTFFKELSTNNNTDWFRANKDRYEKDVKKPFTEFVKDLLTELAKKDKAITMSAKDAIFRINKDTRFSSDKQPYKLSLSAGISKEGRNPACPGIYVELGDGKMTIIMGAYIIEKENLFNVRSRLVKRYIEFERINNKKPFYETFKEVCGEKSIKLQPAFQDIVDEKPFVANKQLYYKTTLSMSLVYSDQIINDVLRVYEAGEPMNAFLQSIIK